MGTSAYEDEVIVFCSVFSSLSHIIVQLAPIASFPEYYCFARAATEAKVPPILIDSHTSQLHPFSCL